MIAEISTYRLVKELINVENKLNEGLILTHDIYESKDIIERHVSKLRFWYDSKIDGTKIILNLTEGKFTDKTYIEFCILLSNLGYYISIIKVTNKHNKTKTIKPNDFKEYYLTNNYLTNIIEYNFIIEPKYDIKHKLKTNILYHVTESKYVDKILKNGLMSKSKNTKTFHPERLYLVYNLEDAEQYIKSKNMYYLTNLNKTKQHNKSKFKEIEFVILKIELPENNDMIFFDDPNFKSKGIYTYENISPKYITIK